MGDMFTSRGNTEIPEALPLICKALGGLSDLRELDMNGNAFGQHIDPLVFLLAECRSLRVLNLENEGLGPVSGAKVAHALAAVARTANACGEHVHLRKLMCGRNRLENGSAEAWKEMFALHPDLRFVDLTQNGIRGPGFEAVVQGLAHCSSIRYLNLNDNTGKTDDGDGWPTFARALRGWPDLRMLDVSNCCLDAESFDLFLEVFQAGQHVHLHSLFVNNSDLGDVAYERLIPVIQTRLPALRNLGLVDNEDLDGSWVKQLVKLLEERGGSVMLDDEDWKEEDWNRVRQRAITEDDIERDVDAKTMVYKSGSLAADEPRQASSDAAVGELLAEMAGMTLTK
jgi:Ran GTPase-activating protein 1